MPANHPRTLRPDPPLAGAERETLRGWLDYHRATLAWKCDGLSDEQFRARPIESSNLTLLGLVRHMAEVERHWFQRVIAGETVAHVWAEEWDFQAAFDVAEATAVEGHHAWQTEMSRAREIEKGVDALDTAFVVQAWECDASLRSLLLHLIHEYARHNGHADLLREAIDGETGA